MRGLDKGVGKGGKGGGDGGDKRKRQRVPRHVLHVWQRWTRGLGVPHTQRQRGPGREREWTLELSGT